MNSILPMAWMFKRVWENYWSQYLHASRIYLDQHSRSEITTITSVNRSIDISFSFKFFLLNIMAIKRSKTHMKANKKKKFMHTMDNKQHSYWKMKRAQPLLLGIMGSSEWWRAIQRCYLAIHRTYVATYKQSPHRHETTR